ncbi:hypothetical protein GE300_20640 [Rhodobacteraceae bacterium 2CG4]|uniref:Rhamnosyltransferase n=1 Tax=Halovulum marinum TaxID=2662447 RepID=A0A6L5Z696_9RHOB|nr:glycosyltransferase [Halovulum marinum]MSU91967.1 hypothetical protein [Halovulum marinum]
MNLPFLGRDRGDGPEPVQVIGLLRFSYFGDGGFRGVPADPAAAAAYLFDDERLARRFHLFETLTVPTLAAQTDPDFTLVVLTSDALPGRHRDRLQAAVDRIPGARLCAQPPLPQWRAVRNAFNPARSRRPALTAQFRLDDDDALATDFVAELRRHAPQLEPLRRLTGAPGVALDFTRGLRLVWGAAGVETVAQNRRIHTSQGMALVTRDRGEKNIMGYPHHKIWQHIPMVSLNEPLMFLQSSHRDQDSGMAAGKPLTAIAPAEAAGLLRRRFGLDLRALAAPG